MAVFIHRATFANFASLLFFAGSNQAGAKQAKAVRFQIQL